MERAVLLGEVRGCPLAAFCDMPMPVALDFNPLTVWSQDSKLMLLPLLTLSPAVGR